MSLLSFYCKLSMHLKKMSLLLSEQFLSDVVVGVKILRVNILDYCISIVIVFRQLYFAKCSFF